MISSQISKASEAFADSYMRGYRAGTEHGLRLQAAEASKALKSQNGRLRVEVGKLKRELAKARELALHLSYCSNCGETSVRNCAEGKELWIAAKMPAESLCDR
jgi:hypothetical protein